MEEMLVWVAWRAEQQKAQNRWRASREAKQDEDNERRLAAIADAHKQEKIAAGKLKEIVSMSKVILDVKPWDSSTDMAELEALVRGITHETNPQAVEWQAAQLEDIGYGIQKLRIMVQVRASTI